MGVYSAISLLLVVCGTCLHASNCKRLKILDSPLLKFIIFRTLLQTHTFILTQQNQYHTSRHYSICCLKTHTTYNVSRNLTTVQLHVQVSYYTCANYYFKLYLTYLTFHFFTTLQLCSSGLAMSNPSVRRPSVCLSVKSVNCDNQSINLFSQLFKITN